MNSNAAQAFAEPQRRKETKCVVWDLDETIWNGILSEQSNVSLKPGIREVLETLDARGILHSIASRNDHAQAMSKLVELGLDHYFIYPQIGWGAKSQSVRAVAERINIGVDTLAFVDDQAFERDEVQYNVPEVMCLDAASLMDIPKLPEMNPRFITEDSKRRRQMYLADAARKQLEDTYTGPQEEFLSSLNMVFTISRAREEDLKRAEELTVRTHQLNTTGYTYSYEELDALRVSPKHLLLIAGLDDRYGTYGKIGLALVEKHPELWSIRLLLMSCRVLSRGVGSVLINHIRTLARDAGVKLQAEMIMTDRNRMAYMTYRFIGFHEVAANGSNVVLECDAGPLPGSPSYLKVVTD